MKINITDIIPELLEAPYATVYAMSMNRMLRIAGTKQHKESKNAYLPTLETGYFFIYDKEIQKGIVYKQTTGNIEDIRYKKPSSILIKADKSIYKRERHTQNTAFIISAAFE